MRASIIIISTCLFILSAGYPAVRDDLVSSLHSFFDGKRYEFKVFKGDLDRAPIWEDKESNPPLSNRGAEKIARDFVKSRVPNSERWKLRKIILEELGTRSDGRIAWIYIVEFTPFIGAQLITGRGNPFQIPILLNGTIPDVKITDYPGR